MNSSPGFVYFDLDNTLLDHTSAEKNALREICSIFKEFESTTFSKWLTAYKEINYCLWLQYQKGEIDRHHLQHSRFKKSMEQLGLSSQRSSEIGIEYMKIYRKYWKWVDGAEEALAMISSRFPVGFITNGFSETQQKKIEDLNLKRFSELFIISEDVGVMKPHPQVFDIATERSSFERDRIVYVGDSYTSDIIGGNNAGWKTAWFTALADEYRECKTADICFSDFSVLVDYLTR